MNFIDSSVSVLLLLLLKQHKEAMDNQEPLSLALKISATHYHLLILTLSAAASLVCSTVVNWVALMCPGFSPGLFCIKFVFTPGVPVSHNSKSHKKAENVVNR